MSSNNDFSFRSITGSPEYAEPAAHSSSQAAMSQARDSSTNRPQPPIPASESGTNAPPPARHSVLNGPRSLNLSGSPSTANSPMSSREHSPARPPIRQPGSSGTVPKSGLRSRKSSTDVSPNRGPSLAGPSSTVLSAAAIQRALSSTNIPQLPPTAQQDPSRVPRPLKPASGTGSGDSTPHWPLSPRLKSPPPSTDARSRSRRNSLRNQTKKTDSQSTPSIVVQSSSPAPASRIPVKDEGVISEPEEQPVSMKASSRGASGAAPKLETVQEATLPTAPGFDSLEVQSLPSTAQGHKSSDDERNDVTSAKVTEDLSSQGARQTESGSDSGIKNDSKGKMQDQRSASIQRPAPLGSKASFSSLSTVKSRTEAPSRNMTVETETVPSIAQATISNQDRSASGRGDGSLRLKPSNETIRPKKEKQRPKRKAPSINSGTASSKADVFEQKVASAVDEADSSDSDATFIYESNPQEQQPHRSRHHSRTPSMTSVHSLADPRLAIREAHKNPNKKTSMKFANPYNNADAEAAGYDRGDGTIRVGSGRVSGGSHHHHIGRHGQGRGALSHVIMDSDSSMAQSSRNRGPSSRQPSQPNSPRFHTFNMASSNGNGNGNGTKKHNEYSAYDVDTENAADDERTPLIQSARSPRVRTPRRRNSTGMRHQIERRHRHNGGWCRRFAGCLVLSILLLVLVFSAVGLVFATTKPLSAVKVREIQNVIASQEELMMDLLVDAVNPNIIGVSIADMDVNVFAKSKHVNSEKWWREHSGKHHNLEDSVPISKSKVDTDEEMRVAGGVDEGTDPIDEPEIGEPRTMLLGRIFHFDSPLNFDGSFFKHKTVESLGGMRLSKPGNKTEAGGTERWEEVLQHPFELIVRGVFKYQLPLSTREHSVSVTASYYYDPDNEKKKLKALSEEQVFAPKNRHSLPHYVQSSRPFGRFDVRSRSFPLLEK